MNYKDYIALVDRAKRLSYEYYVLAQPTVSDAQFDALVSEIEQAEAAHPEWTLADSPTQVVGSDVQDNGRRLIQHRTRMLSCQKAQTQEAVTKWLAQTEKKLHGAQVYALEWKYDGISCSLVYQDGRLISAATRGDKDCGQDLLAHVMRMPSVPKHISMAGRVEVRGEIVCPKTELAALGYKDFRTAAAALANQVVPSGEVERLVFIAWQMDSDEQPFGTESVSIVAAQQQGFLCDVRTCDGADVCKALDEYSELRESLPYPTDGVVIKIDNKATAASMGCTEHHPKGNIAYKFVAQKAVTRVLRIEVSVGSTGKRTPVAYLEPVMIMGREVKQASLYSEKKMAELGVTEGCLVEVGLSNDVTPKVYGVVGSPDGEPSGTVAEPCGEPSGAMAEPAEEPAGTVAEPTEEPAGEVVEPAEEPMPLPKPKTARPKKKAKQGNRSVPNNRYDVIAEHRNGDNRQAANDQPTTGQGGHQVLKAIGSVAAMTVALVVIWQTGLLIPLGLIGLATSGIIK